MPNEYGVQNETAQRDFLNPEQFTPGMQVPIAEFTPEKQMTIARRKMHIEQPEGNQQPAVPSDQVMISESEYDELQKYKNVVSQPEFVDRVVSRFANNSIKNEQPRMNQPIANPAQVNQPPVNNQNNQTLTNQQPNQQVNNPGMQTANQNDAGSQANDQSSGNEDDLLSQLLNDQRDDSKNQNQANDVNQQNDNNNQQFVKQNQYQQMGPQPNANTQMQQQGNQQMVDPAQVVQKIQAGFKQDLDRAATKSGYPTEKVTRFIQQMTPADLVTLAKQYYGDQQPQNNFGTKNISDAGPTPQVTPNRSMLSNRGKDPNRYF